LQWKKWNATTCYEAFPNTNNATNPSGTLNHIFLCGGIGHWMWKHLVGLTPAAPGFAEVSLIPRVHDAVGPRAVAGDFLSPKGLISCAWKLGAAGTVSLSVRLPVGVGAATVVVPKPTAGGLPAAAASIKLGGTVIWDGAKLVGKPAGILSAEDQPGGVAFKTTNGAFEFESAAKAGGRLAVL
jgi:alpha-L-rhamnosidase